MKRLVVCCDGTWNRPDQRSPTNVVKLASAVAAVGTDGVTQRTLYQRGVGTTRGERLRGGIFGFGLARNVREAYTFLVHTYEPGDEVYVFGFSRGAFTARSTAGFVRNCGVLRIDQADRLREAYALYRSRDKHPSSPEATAFREKYSHEIRVRFVGVWDTVGALGVPGHLLSFLNRRTRFHDTALSSTVRAGFHALAVDERRRPFRPTIWRTTPDADQVVEQVWFAGVHSDVGGGYPETGLADLTLAWMVGKCREHGLTVDQAVLDAGTWLDGSGMPMQPDALAQRHESYTGFYRLTRPYVRPVDATSPETESVSPSVEQRRAADGTYRPPNVPAAPPTLS
ncbi:DUF2235 domain-containing protein [Jatrophihabitans fulvus]